MHSFRNGALAVIGLFNVAAAIDMAVVVANHREQRQLPFSLRAGDAVYTALGRSAAADAIGAATALTFTVATMPGNVAGYLVGNHLKP